MQNGVTNTENGERLELSEMIARVKAIFRIYNEKKDQGGWYQQIEDFKSYIDEEAESNSKYHGRPPINSPIELKTALLEFCEKELQARGWTALNKILTPTGFKFAGRSSLKTELLQLCNEISYSNLDEVDLPDKDETDLIAENEALKQKLKELEEQRMTELEEHSANKANEGVLNTQPHPTMQTPAPFNTVSTLNPIQPGLLNPEKSPPLYAFSALTNAPHDLEAPNPISNDKVPHTRQESLESLDSLDSSEDATLAPEQNVTNSSEILDLTRERSRSGFARRLSSLHKFKN